MFAMAGIAVIFIMVFGGYVLAGGKMGIILKALPFEMIMIGGAAVGAFLLRGLTSIIMVGLMARFQMPIFTI